MSDDNTEVPPAAALPKAPVEGQRLARTAGEAVDFVKALRRLRADRAAATISEEEYRAALLALQRGEPVHPGGNGSEAGGAPDASRTPPL